MRVAVISPFSAGPRRGNITTVDRIVRSLEQLGAELLVMPVDAVPRADMLTHLKEFEADIIHGFHARYCGDTARQLARSMDIPYLLTITGSDISDPVLRSHPDTADAISSAAVVACFDNHEAGLVATCFPEAVNRVVLVPQGVEPPPVTGGMPDGVPDDALVLLLPAALRPVKNIEFPLRALLPLAEAHPQLLLVIAGGVIDRAYADRVQKILSRTPFARWLGEVPYGQMGDLYARADIVLNCSRFEGMPNSLMEAMALGRPVLAVDIPGNRSLVREGETGLLFHGAESFRRQLLRLIHNPQLRTRCAGNAREHMLTAFPPMREAKQYLSLYQRVLRDTNGALSETRSARIQPENSR